MPPAELILLYAVMPAWLLAGICDWWRHCATDIEHTSGVRESALHLLMYFEGGIAVLAGLFLEINALMLVLFFLLLIAHEATAWWDVSYANHRREITPVEQHIHAFLEILPFLAFALVCILHWDQWTSLFAAGAPVDFSIARKKAPLPPGFTGMVLAVAALEIVLYGQEFYRCLKERGIAALVEVP